VGENGFGYAKVSREWFMRASAIKSTLACRVACALLSMPYVNSAPGWSGSYEAIRKATGTGTSNTKLKPALEALHEAGLIRLEFRPRIKVRLLDPWISKTNPLGTETNPLGTETNPLGTETNPLGTEAEHSEPTQPPGYRYPTPWVPLPNPLGTATQPPGYRNDKDDRDEDPEIVRAPAREEPPREASGSKSRKRRWRFVPKSWKPTDRHRELAAELGVDLEAQAEMFRSHEFATPKSDGNRAFSNWLRRSADYSRGRGNSGPPQPNSGYDFSQFDFEG